MTEVIDFDNGLNDYHGYERSDEELHALTLGLIKDHERPGNNERFVCYCVDGDSEYADIARTLERRVFEEVFEGNDAAFMQREYGPYDASSKFFVSVDRATGVPTGALRVIYNSSEGLKTLNDLDNPDEPPFLTKEEIIATHNIDDLDKCWDIGTVAVPEEFRHSGVSTQLYRGMYVKALQEDIKHFVAVIDEKPLAALTGFLNIPFVPMCNSKPFNYLESLKSQAVYGHVPDFDPVINGRLDSLTGNTPEERILRRALEKIIRGTADDTLYF